MIPRSLQIAVAVLLLAAFGLGFYALHLKQTAGRPQSPVESRPMTPPVAGPATEVTLWVANDGDGYLHSRRVAITLPEGHSSPGTVANAAQQIRARELLRALVAAYRDPSSSHPLASAAAINEIYLVNDSSPTPSGTGSMVIVDVNAAFADAHRSGILVEELTLASMARTLAANVPGVTRMKILVEGKERDTLAGHADLQDWYEVAAANRLVKQE